MSTYRLLKHKDFDRSAQNLPTPIRQKALWAQVLLGTRGRTPSVKGTAGINARWRRTPVQGNHYYMWWIPQSESGLPADVDSPYHSPILIHSIRHHDQTDTPINLGTLRDYEEISVADLDPRFDEQREISNQLKEPDLSLATIKGLPGSGKTISLLYLVRDVLQQTRHGKILYVTYTPRLKRAAQEFLYAHDEQVRQRVLFRTLNELESDFTNIPVHTSPFRALEQFEKAMVSTSLPSLGPWRKFPQALYTEIRAHLLGRNFPPGYTLPGNPNGETHVPLQPFSADAYAALRGVDRPAAIIAYKIAARVVHERYFQEQKAARVALSKLSAGEHPDWLTDLGAMIVDEVQDLTLLQIAFLGELARARAHQIMAMSTIDAPFIFTVAGDESQIVQPSGFDWGATKDLLGEQLGTWPEEFEFRHQRRAPRLLTHVIDNSWNLYSHLPRTDRPSAQRQSFVDEAMEAAHQFEDGGRILLCPLPKSSAQSKTARRKSTGPDWEALFDALNEKPGRVVIDVSESLHKSLPASAHSLSEEVLFLPRDIKGLERATVILYGLNSAYEYALRLCDEAQNQGSAIPRFEARRTFDEIRVALSRATGTLILLEAPGAPVLQELGIGAVDHAANGVTPAEQERLKPIAADEYGVIDWDELLETLRIEEMSELEIIEGYLDEVDDLIERERWEQAYRRNRRAHELALHLQDHALQREANDQYIQTHIEEAESLAQRNDWEAAYTLNRRAHTLAEQFNDPLLHERIDEQAQKFSQAIVQQIEKLRAQAQEWAASHSYTLAHQDVQQAQALAQLIQNAEIENQVDATLAEICWQWAYHLTPTGSTEHRTQQAAQLLEEAAVAQERRKKPGRAQGLRTLAQRYRQAPLVGELTKKQVGLVIESAHEFLQIMEPLDPSPDTYAFIERWMEETYEALGNFGSLYYNWATAAQRLDDVAIYGNFHDHIWDLENRAEMLTEQTRSERQAQQKFQAFLLGYNGEHAEASAAWEALGEIEQAARQAREAGQIERAYELLRRAKAPIPEELGTAVHALRRLDKLTHKHDALKPAERRVIIEQLSQVQEALSASSPDEPAEE